MLINLLSFHPECCQAVMSCGHLAVLFYLPQSPKNHKKQRHSFRQHQPSSSEFLVLLLGKARQMSVQTLDSCASSQVLCSIWGAKGSSVSDLEVMVNRVCMSELTVQLYKKSLRSAATSIKWYLWMYVNTQHTETGPSQAHKTTLLTALP